MKNAWAGLLGALMSMVVADSGLAADAGRSEPPALHWKSKNEEGVYGYIVYRSDNRAGPFLRLNPRVVLRHADTGASANQEYRYVDDSASPQKAYYYYIDAIGDSGRRQRLTDIVRREPSKAAAGKP